MNDDTRANRKDASGNPRKVLLGALEGSLGFRLRRAQLAVLKDLIDALAPIGLRPAQFSVLSLIDANTELGQSDLSAALRIQRGNLVAMLDELEERGLTERRVSAQDRRVNTLSLTTEGCRLLKRAVAIHSAHEKRLLKQLGSAGQLEFAGHLDKLISSV